MSKFKFNPVKKYVKEEYFFNTRASRIPIDIKRLRTVEECGTKVPLLQPPRNNLELEDYSTVVSSLKNLLGDYVYWDLYSGVLDHLVYRGSIKAYTSVSKDVEVSPEIESIADMVYEITNEYSVRVGIKSRVKSLEETSLWFAYHLCRMSHNNKLAVQYSRRKGFYQKSLKVDSSRGDHLKPSLQVLVRIVDAFVEKGLAVNFKGYKKNNRLSLFVPTAELLKTLTSLDTKDFMFKNDKSIVGSLVEVRDKNKNVIPEEEYPSDWKPVIEYSKRVLGKQNSLISEHTISIVDDTLEDFVYRRILSNSSVEEAGRIFDRGEFTTIRRELRKRLLISGNKVVTIDLCGLHPRLLYRKKGIELPEDFDPYPSDIGITIDDKLINKFRDFYHIDSYNPVRNVCKLALLILINSSNIVEAKAALRGKLLDDKKLAFTCREDTMLYVGLDASCVDKIFEAVINKNQDISEFFCTQACFELMNIDSKIMLATIDRLVDAGILGLSLHDSITVQEHHAEEAEKLLREAYKEVLGDTINYKVKFE